MSKYFNHSPVIGVKGGEGEAFSGWQNITKELKARVSGMNSDRVTVVVETYQGVYEEALRDALIRALDPDHIHNSRDSFKDQESIRNLTFPDVTDDRIFGYITRLNMQDLMDPQKMQAARERVQQEEKSLVLIIGPGASLIWEQPSLLVYADMARWELQLRMRRNEVDNLGLRNREEHIEALYKRGYFLDWRICDRMKKKLMHSWDYVLDTNNMDLPVLARGEAVREGLRQAAKQPFSLVPFFDPGPWGGQWMKENLNLDRENLNYAWCFNCVPEENSLLLGFGEIIMELPSVNLVFYQPVELLGDPVHGMFGDEFPIRFDYLDTMEGGNLSLQVHPLTSYIQENFGMHYTQDESYYMLDAGKDASVYLGLKEGLDKEEMKKDLRISEKEQKPFAADKYIQKWPAKKHDHFLIPAGTVHCSGENGMVLEISATPYIFTFKLYDWGRVNMDGTPRPINIEHGINNIQWERNTSWTRDNLVNQITQVASGEGWREEKTGLHEREFIETRRHWFSKELVHQTNGSVHVLNLVDGEEVIVESPTGAFEPFIVHYAETFVVPEAVKEYSIRPHGPSEGRTCATVKAYIRNRS